MAVNKIFLIGRLTKDAELKIQETTGKMRAVFRLAVPGYSEGDTVFINCVSFNEKLAESIVNNTGKGSKLHVIGRLKVYEQKLKEGYKQTTEIIVESVEFLDGFKREPEEEPPF